MTNNDVLARQIAVAIARQCYLANRYATKIEVHQAVQAATWDKDGVKQKQRVEVIFAEAERIRLLKCARFHRLPDPPGPNLAQRLDAFKRQRFCQVLRTTRFRTSESGNHHTELNFVDDPARVGAEGISTEGRKYPNSWSRTKNSLHRYYVLRLWHSQTVKEGIAILGGRFTLFAALKYVVPGCDVENVAIEDGVVDQVRVYEAVWCEQGRGFSLTTRRGAIAVLWAKVGFQVVKLSWFHAADDNQVRAVNRAYVGVLRRARQKTPQRRERRPRFEREEQQFGDYPISLEEVVHLGFCKTGVKKWCAKTGTNIESGMTTLRYVIQGYRTHPVRQALWIIRHFVTQAKLLPPVGARVRFTGEGGFTFSLN